MGISPGFGQKTPSLARQASGWHQVAVWRIRLKWYIITLCADSVHVCSLGRYAFFGNAIRRFSIIPEIDQ